MSGKFFKFVKHRQGVYAGSFLVKKPGHRHQRG